MVRHDLDLSGLGPSFRRFCSSLNAQRMNYLPHSALQARTPASILYPDRSLPFKYFLPFGCKATVLKGAAARKANVCQDCTCCASRLGGPSVWGLIVGCHCVGRTDAHVDANARHRPSHGQTSSAPRSTAATGPRAQPAWLGPLPCTYAIHEEIAASAPRAFA